MPAATATAYTALLDRARTRPGDDVLGDAADELAWLLTQHQALRALAATAAALPPGCTLRHVAGLLTAGTDPAWRADWLTRHHVDPDTAAVVATLRPDQVAAYVHTPTLLPGLADAVLAIAAPVASTVTALLTHPSTSP